MRLIFATLLLLCALPAAAQVWWFDDKRYYEPLIAGVREPHISALLAAGDPIEFEVSADDPRIVGDIDVGYELPIVGWDAGDGTGGRVAENSFGVGLWIPIDFHMIQDLKDRSAPIVNNDYRFGAMVKVQYGLTPNEWLAARLHVGHESTHLGDEFSIVGQRQFPRTFERIDVSWEYADLGLLYERQRSRHSWSVRTGATYNLRGSYYGTGADSVTESARGPVSASKNRLDWYLGSDLLWAERLGSWDIYASGEVRFRTIYDYHRPTRDTPEDKQASFNVIVGVKANGANRASPFLRLYRGVNPHGQFRNQKDYTEIGLGVRLVR